MAKTINITEKLNFEENPKIKIQNEKFEINADATTILKIIGNMSEEKMNEPSTVVEMYELLFTKKDRKRIEELKLSFADFQVLISTAIQLVTGGEEVGE